MADNVKPLLEKHSGYTYEFAGVPVPEGYMMDGRSFMPQLKGEQGSPHDWLFFHFEPMNGRHGVFKPAQRFIRDHRWKLYEDGRLFDLSADPDEDEAIFDEGDTGESGAARKNLERALKLKPELVWAS